MSGAITIQNTYDHEQAGRYELRYARLATKHVKGLESVLRLDLDVWSPSGATLVIEPAPDRVSAVLRHRLSEKGSGCWITVEHNGEARAEAEHTSTISVTIEKSQNVAVPSARGPPIIMVNGESIKLEREELDDAEVQSRRMQKRIANRAIMLDRSPTPRATAHFGRPPSIAEAPISTPTATSRAPTPTAHKRVKSAANAADMNASSDLTSKLPIHYAFDALSILQQLHQENADARVDESDWTILSYAENNAPIRISKRNMPSLSLNLPLYRVERTLPGVSEEQLLRLIQSNSSNTRTTWDERLSSIENIAQYDNACSSSIWIARPSFPTRSRIAYMASVRAREEVANDGPAKQETSVTYVAASSVPLSAFDLDCSEGRAIVASERLNPSKLLETYVPLEGWVIETNAGVKDEEDDESETQTYTKCSFYTCSDIPLMVAGSFGQSALRARLARILDLLESLSKSTSAGLVARFPEPAYSIGNIYRMSPESWIVRPGQRCSSAVGFLGNSMTFKIRLPFPPSAPPLSSHDIESSSLAGGSGVSQRSLGLRSIGAEAHVEESAVGSLATRDEANDTVIAEIVFLRDLTVSGYEVRSSATLPAGLVLPTDTSFWTKLSPLPFKAQLYSESPSGKSDTSYILRISLPTGQYTAPMEHPLSALADSPSLPRWYRKLSTESGVVQFQATPVRNLSRADGRPMSTLKVTLDGLEVPYSTDYRKLLKTEEWPLDSLVGYVGWIAYHCRT